MKKIYAKPDIVFENFELSKSIAPGCEAYITWAEYVCPVTIPDEGVNFTVFTVKSACDYTDPEGQNLVCYHNPTETYNVYSS